MKISIPAQLLFALLCCALVVVARADDVISSNEFVDEVSAMNLGQIKMAQIALDKDGATQEVLDLANRLKDDHQRMNSELKTVAGIKQLDMANGADAHDLASAAKLMVLRGDLFNESFVNTQVAAQERFIKYMEQAQQQLQDPELKQFAKSKLPGLQSHLEMAQRMQTMDPQE